MLRDVEFDGCYYEFEWHTAAACVLSKTEGVNCTVLDAQAGLYPSSSSVACCVLGPQVAFAKDLAWLLGVTCFRTVHATGQSPKHLLLCA